MSTTPSTETRTICARARTTGHPGGRSVDYSGAFLFRLLGYRRRRGAGITRETTAPHRGSRPVRYEAHIHVVAPVLALEAGRIDGGRQRREPDRLHRTGHLGVTTQHQRGVGIGPVRTHTGTGSPTRRVILTSAAPRTSARRALKAPAARFRATCCAHALRLVSWCYAPS
jgi:hypothetical protein